MYSQQFVVRWSDLDANAHMKNTAYIEYAMQVRIAHFAEHGFSAEEFSRRRFGPIVFREEVTYFKDVRMMPRRPPKSSPS
jgi:acyl-CoA thioester hydrolase